MRLTIFTPTYNRAYILPMLYESLCQQTCQDFEWLVVDDGSTDDTRDLVAQWEREARIHIRYHHQQNGGKMRAYNQAVSMTRTEWFVCIDSDDQLASPTALADSLSFWDESVRNGLPGGTPEARVIGWISLRRMPDSPAVVGRSPYVARPTAITSSLKGETTLFLKTAILSRYPYWVHPAERFIPDNYIFDQIDEDFLALFHPYYSQVCQYQDEGLTRNWRRWLFTNPHSYREFHAQRIRLKKPDRWRSVVCYISISLFLRDGRFLLHAPARLLTLALLPVGVLKHFYDRYMLSKEA